MLSRLHATSDLLRRVARIQHLVKRLNSQMKLADINKAAQCLSELAQLSENVDLSGLEVLEEDQRSIRSHRVELERQARTMLTQGLKAQNQSQLHESVFRFSVVRDVSCLLTCFKVAVATNNSVVAQHYGGTELNVRRCRKDVTKLQSCISTRQAFHGPTK
uniref:Conserved oligomeric Golgi complex subunit 5 helical domain-containing protein n=1 Tax=Timema shepardi TaxID=629360 RepID=A0A7R9BC24_TIMSH|nr:unnamed protein product [Timema shepardi]